MPKKNAEEPFSVSFNFGYGKNLCTRGVYHDILSKIFRLTVSKKVVQQSFSVSLIRVSKNFLHWKDNHEFLSKILVSQCRKKL